ncbi:hypothetical protein [Snodgrassella communis]|uniref:hypothetical protein n=1 Tax=Snodgrassella communis TaxID=2946699 RepID=UPI000C1DE2B6|nr:hypothetical protein [Snodgrassella communis]PIT07990.1 hypothetical protein BGI31_08370 [Snodgrassella communis]
MNDELKDFEQEIHKKIIAGEELSDDELREVLACFEVDEEVTDKNRWDEDVQTIVRLNDKYYAIDWRRGLTENQDNSYGNQPYEVLKRTKTVTDWVPVSWEQNEDDEDEDEDEDY